MIISQEMRKIAGDVELILMEPGATRDVSGISVKTVPAYNRLKPFHPKRNGWCGYVVTMDGGRYYVAGDTDAINELSSVKCGSRLITEALLENLKMHVLSENMLTRR